MGIRKNVLIMTLLFTLLCISCNDKQSEKAEVVRPQRIETIKDLTMPMVVPLVDGGSYACSFTGTIWYVNKGKAVIVKLENGTRTDQAQELTFLDEPVPSIDGGAYINVHHWGLGYLKKDTLYKVNEVNKIIEDSISKIPLQSKLYLLLANQISKKMKDIQDEKNEQEMDDDGPTENDRF
jgi:hypothetical protein